MFSKKAKAPKFNDFVLKFSVGAKTPGRGLTLEQAAALAKARWLVPFLRTGKAVVGWDPEAERERAEEAWNPGERRGRPGREAIRVRPPPSPYEPDAKEVLDAS